MDIFSNRMIRYLNLHTYQGRCDAAVIGKNEWKGWVAQVWQFLLQTIVSQHDTLIALPVPAARPVASFPTYFY